MASQRQQARARAAARCGSALWAMKRTAAACSPATTSPPRPSRSSAPAAQRPWACAPSPPCLKPATPQPLLLRPGRGVPRAVASRWPARPRGRPGLPADLRPHHRVRAHRGHRQLRSGTGSPRRSPGDTVRLTHPNLVHAGNASRRYGPAGSGSTTPPAGRSGWPSSTRHDQTARSPGPST